MQLTTESLRLHATGACMRWLTKQGVSQCIHQDFCLCLQPLVPQSKGAPFTQSRERSGALKDMLSSDSASKPSCFATSRPRYSRNSCLTAHSGMSSVCFDVSAAAAGKKSSQQGERQAHHVGNSLHRTIYKSHLLKGKCTAKHLTCCSIN